MILLSLLLPAALFADAVRLRTGEVVVGTITGQTRDDVSISVNGRTRVIRKSEIQRVVYGSAEAELKKAEEQRRLWEEQKRQNERAQAERDRAAAASGLHPVWKSAMLPGWGQYASGHERIGIGTGSLLGLTALYSFRLRTTALSAKSTYDTTSTLSKSILLLGAPVAGPVMLDYSAKETYAQRVHSYNQSLNILALLYFAQIAHTFFLARSGPGSPAFHEPVHSPLSIAEAPPGARGAALAFTLRFAF